MYKFIFFFSILFTLSSCFEERIDLDLNEGNEKLVIVAWISDLDEAQFVTLTKSANYLGEDTNEFVPDATVILSDEVRSYDLAYRGEGNYYLPDDWQARLGDLYRLDVLYDGVEYSAEHTMRPCPAIEELVYEIDESTDSTEWVVPTFAFQETPGEGDAYFGIDYLKGSPIGKWTENILRILELEIDDIRKEIP